MLKLNEIGFAYKSVRDSNAGLFKPTKLSNEHPMNIKTAIPGRSTQKSKTEFKSCRNVASSFSTYP